MKYLKWAIIALLALAGFAVYGEIQGGASFGFAISEVAAPFLIGAVILALVYGSIVGARKIAKR